MGQIGYQLRSHNLVCVQDMLISCYNCIVPIAQPSVHESTRLHTASQQAQALCIYVCT